MNLKPSLKSEGWFIASFIAKIKINMKNIYIDKRLFNKKIVSVCLIFIYYSF